MNEWALFAIGYLLLSLLLSLRLNRYSWGELDAGRWWHNVDRDVVEQMPWVVTAAVLMNGLLWPIYIAKRIRRWVRRTVKWRR